MSDQHYHDPYNCSSNAGRWNPKGMRMMYASNSPAVSQLEYLCIKGNAVGKYQWHMITYEIPDQSKIGELDKAALPADWNALPLGRSTQEFGRAWLLEGMFPFLKVPSARIPLEFYPREHNILIHPDFPLLGDLLKVKNVTHFGYLLG